MRHNVKLFDMRLKCNIEDKRGICNEELAKEIAEELADEFKILVIEAVENLGYTYDTILLTKKDL